MAQAGSDDPTIPAHARRTATPPPRSAARGGEGAGGGGGARLAPATVVSRYRIESVLGEGGMGVVYLARQERPDRQVALKLIRPGLANQRMLRRFEHEAEVLGRLLHPGIAQIYEAGTADAGFGLQPFFAMELVRGVPLTEYASQKELTTRQRLELMARVCDAVEHAHQKGIIHRDLKPGNILITEEGQPKILDFGVARATDSDLQQTTMQTDIGALLGTVPYMSPEQVGGDPAELDTRSDVYALGVILFELLAGRLPYSLERRMIHEAARVIREEEPTRLSSINKTLRGDVETIVSHALEKDKARRYQSASGLAADLRRYLAHEPISARPASTWYQLSKFSRRNRGLVGGVVAAFAVLIVGLAVSLYAFGQARHQRDAKDEALTLARTNEELAKDEAEKARLAQEAEKQRADELDQVARFQAAQFEGIDTQLMGIRLREDLIADAAGALEKSGMPAEEVAAAKAQLEETLARGNPTNVALKSLYDNIFAPALKTVAEQFADQPLVRAQLLQTLAITLRKLGLLEHALPPQTVALDLLRGELSDGNPITYVVALDNMGGLLMEQGKLEEAEKFFTHALEESHRLLGPESLDGSSILNNLGVLRDQQGRLAEAEAFYEQALERTRRQLGDDHPDTFRLRANMAALLESQGKFESAKAAFADIYETSHRVLGADDPDTLRFAGQLGSLLKQQGNPNEAEPYLRLALEGQRRVLGADHPDTIRSLNKFGNLLFEQGRASESQPYLMESLSRARRILGEEHPETIRFAHNIGFVQEDPAEARRYVEEALNKSRRVLGPEHPDTLSYLRNLGALLRDQGLLSDAETCFREALGKRRRVLSNEHPDTLSSISDLAMVLKMQGSLSEAEPLADEAVERSHRVLGEAHPNTLLRINNLGHVIHAIGNLEAAEACFDQGTKRAVAALGDHAVTALLEHHQAEILLELGRIEEATTLAESAVDRYQRIPNSSRNEVSHALQVLTICHARAISTLFESGRIAEATSAAHEFTRRLGEKTDDKWIIAHITSLGASDLITSGASAPAEVFARNSLAICEVLHDANDPYEWRMWWARSLLGEAILSQITLINAEPAANARLEEARSLLIDSAQWMHAKDRKTLVSEPWFNNLARETADRVIRMYESWNTAEPGKGYDAKAAEWRAKLEKLQASTRPATLPTTSPATEPAPSGDDKQAA